MVLVPILQLELKSSQVNFLGLFPIHGNRISWIETLTIAYIIAQDERFKLVNPKANNIYYFIVYYNNNVKIKLYLIK